MLLSPSILPTILRSRYWCVLIRPFGIKRWFHHRVASNRVATASQGTSLCFGCLASHMEVMCLHLPAPFAIRSVSLERICSGFCVFLVWGGFFCFLGSHPWHMEVPRLEVESELRLLAYATATATQDPSHVWNLHHSSWQRQIPDPLSEARDRTHNLMVPSRIHFRCATPGTPR